MAGKFALIIGNSEYEDTNLARLVTPAADVNALSALLRDAEIGAFDEVMSLVNEQSATIRRRIASFFAQKTADDLLLLYFSGHGVLDDQGELYLAAKDTERDLISGTAIPAAEITREMNKSHSRRKVLILDCCHSGAFARGTKGVAGAGASVGTASVFEGTGYGRVVLTATDATQYAWEGDQVIGRAENSVFTHYLIEGLKTGAADRDGDGQITLDELYTYVHAQVVNITPKQTPGKWNYNQQGDIVIAKNPRHVLKPAELPRELREAIESSFASIREGAVRELDRFLNGSNPGLAIAAQEALKRLAEDDSRRVATLATEVLSAYSATTTANVQEREEQQRIARERAEAERLAAQRAEAERVAREKAEQERLAREHAESQHVAEQKAETEHIAREKTEQVQKEAPPSITTISTVRPKSRWRTALLIGSGWGLSVFLLSSLESGLMSQAIVTGLVGGIITSFALRLREPLVSWRDAVIISIGWTGAWYLAWLIYIYAYSIVPIAWIIGGSTIGFVLRWKKLIAWKQVAFVAIGWSVAYVIGLFNMILSSVPFGYEIGYAILGLISGTIGSAVTLLQIPRVPRSLD